MKLIAYAESSPKEQEKKAQCDDHLRQSQHTFLSTGIEAMGTAKISYATAPHGSRNAPVQQDHCC